jgi:hypothetical protein
MSETAFVVERTVEGGFTAKAVLLLSGRILITLRGEWSAFTLRKRARFNSDSVSAHYAGSHV